MKRENEIYSLNSGSGYSPFVYKSTTGLTYCFPVSSGHAELEFEFEISEQDLAILTSSTFRFKALYFILFNEAQSTFGTGHSNPRRYTHEEFEDAKNRVLYESESELTLHIKAFSRERNLAENYFDSFSKTVFP